MNSNGFDAYLELRKRLVEVRKLHQESPEEDDILDDMEAIWWKLTQQERDILDSEIEGEKINE